MRKFLAKLDCGCCNTTMSFETEEACAQAFALAGLQNGAEIIDDAGEVHSEIDTFYGFWTEDQPVPGLNTLLEKTMEKIRDLDKDTCRQYFLAVLEQVQQKEPGAYAIYLAGNQEQPGLPVMQVRIHGEGEYQDLREYFDGKLENYFYEFARSLALYLLDFEPEWEFQADQEQS